MGKLEAQMQKGKMSPKRKELLNMREKKEMAKREI